MRQSHTQTSPESPAYFVILSGGIDSRSWLNESRASPKQDLSLLGGNSPFGLIAEHNLHLCSKTIVVGSRKNLSLSGHASEAPWTTDHTEIVEFLWRNTIAVLAVQRQGTLFVNPLDHVITRQQANRTTTRYVGYIGVQNLALAKTPNALLVVNNFHTWNVRQF